MDEYAVQPLKGNDEDLAQQVASIGKSVHELEKEKPVVLDWPSVNFNSHARWAQSPKKFMTVCVVFLFPVHGQFCASEVVGIFHDQAHGGAYRAPQETVFGGVLSILIAGTLSGEDHGACQDDPSVFDGTVFVVRRVEGTNWLLLVSPHSGEVPSCLSSAKSAAGRYRAGCMSPTGSAVEPPCGAMRKPGMDEG